MPQSSCWFLSQVTSHKALAAWMLGYSLHRWFIRATELSVVWLLVRTRYPDEHLKSQQTPSCHVFIADIGSDPHPYRPDKGLLLHRYVGDYFDRCAHRNESDGRHSWRRFDRTISRRWPSNLGTWKMHAAPSLKAPQMNRFPYDSQVSGGI